MDRVQENTCVLARGALPFVQPGFGLSFANDGGGGSSHLQACRQHINITVYMILLSLSLEHTMTNTDFLT